MTSTATINISNSPKSPKVFHVSAGQNNSSPSYPSGNNQIGSSQMVPQISMLQGPKLAYSASSYPPELQQQYYQKQYQPQQQFQMEQQYEPNQLQYFQSQGMHQQQPNYYQAEYQPQEQFQQQYQSNVQSPHLMSISNFQPDVIMQKSNIVKPPVFEAPIEKIQIVKKSQSSPFKSPTNMQQSFRSSRSGSFVALEEITDPPHFIKHPESRQTTSEGDPISLAARVTPAGDPSLTVQWYKDGNPLSAGSRFNTSFERGFAILDILYTFKEDSGEYSCVAKNNFGMDQTSPSILNVTVEENIVLKSHLPQEMTDNIASMEAAINSQKKIVENSEIPVRPPQFIKPIPSLYNLLGGQSVHLETRITPMNDSSLTIEWFKNGKPLNNGCRLNVIFDRGFAILDINGVISEDSGDYFCYAVNKCGQAQSNIVRLIVADEETIVTKSQLPKESVQYLQALDAQLVDEVDRSTFRYEEEEEIESLPHFDIKPVDLTIEDASPARFLVKVNGYPRPKIQWFVNDCLVVSSSTQKVYNDGSISYLEFQKCKMIGDNHITVLAKNKLGEAVCNAVLNVIPENNFVPELKRTDPENPFRKLTTLKKVEVSPELLNAFEKQKSGKSGNVQMNNSDRISLCKSREASDAENLYANVQSKLRRSDKLSYAGAPTGGNCQPQIQNYPETATKSSQFTIQIGSSNISQNTQAGRNC